MKQETIDELAKIIYPILVATAAKRNGTISYEGLCDQLNAKWADLNPSHPLLFHALGRIVGACQNEGLPALSCVVVHKSGDKMPGQGYFEAAHGGETDPEKRIVKWGAECAAAWKASYPPEVRFEL